MTLALSTKHYRCYYYYFGIVYISAVILRWYDVKLYWWSGSYVSEPFKWILLRYLHRRYFLEICNGDQGLVGNSSLHFSWKCNLCVLDLLVGLGEASSSAPFVSWSPGLLPRGLLLFLEYQAPSCFKAHPPPVPPGQAPSSSQRGSFSPFRSLRLDATSGIYSTRSCGT